MPRIFIPPEQFHGDAATVCGADHLHLARVLRARPGDIVELLDNRGGAFAGTILAIERDCTHLRIDGTVTTRPEPATNITVAQAFGKADKFEQVVQHGTEVGASEFVPVRADRCVVNVPVAQGRAADRLARWNQIAKDAAQQCGRCRIPFVKPPVRSLDLFRRPENVRELESSTAISELRLLLHPCAGATPIRAVLDALTNRLSTVTIAIGPEGGWSPEEVAIARSSGWLEVALGPYVLRTETAALVAISLFMHCLEDQRQNNRIEESE